VSDRTCWRVLGWALVEADLQLVLDTTDPAVIEAVERAAAARGVTLVRLGDDEGICEQ
jgi:hypothetical protein